MAAATPNYFKIHRFVVLSLGWNRAAAVRRPFGQLCLAILFKGCRFSRSNLLLSLFMIQHDLTDMGPTREIDLPQLQLQGMKRKDGGISIHETQILKCTISHCRLFPKKHRFAYAYLSVGIPVRSPTSNWLLSVDDVSWWQKGWFHVSPQDHLARGRHGATLSQNLDEYLKHQVRTP